MTTGERFALGVSNCRAAADVVDAVVRAERLGAERAFIAEDVNCRDAFALAAVAAERTHRIHLGPGVANPYTRAPNSLAMAVATLDDISAGRAFLGLGSSSKALIEGQLGIEHGSSLPVMTETIEVVRRFLSGKPVTFTGRRYRLHEARLAVPARQSHLAIVVAAMGPRMLALAGRLADGVLLNVGATPEYVRWAVEQVRAGARSAGRAGAEITIAAWLSVYITDDVARTLPRVRAWLAGMLSIPGQGELLLAHAGVDASILAPIRAAVSAYPHSGDATVAARSVPVEAAMRMAVIGDVAAVRARLNEYRAAGVELPVMGIEVLERLYGP